MKHETERLPPVFTHGGVRENVQRFPKRITPEIFTSIFQKYSERLRAHEGLLVEDGVLNTYYINECAGRSQGSKGVGVLGSDLGGGEAERLRAHEGLLVEDGVALEALEVELLVAGVLVHDEEVAPVRGQDEAQVELPGHLHLREVPRVKHLPPASRNK
eukprot:1179868-Prorocentrum_minimum.AAC.9